MASGFTDKFSVRVKKEREKIKNHKGLKGKLSYIWDYYKVPILAIVIGIAAIVSIVRAIISNNYNTSLYVSYVNCISVDLRDDTKILDNSLTEWLGIDGRKNRVRVDGYYTINLMVVTQTSDCYIGDDVFTNLWAKSEYLRDLSVLLPAELLTKVSDRLVYYTDTESGFKRVVGIDLAGLPFMTDVLGIGIEHPIFSVVVNAPNPDNCITFLEHILDYK